VLAVVAQRGEQVGQVMVEEPVVGVAPVAAHGHEPLLAQETQLVGDGRLLHADPCGEVLDRALAVQQRPQQPQAAGRAERAQRLGQARGLVAAQRPRRVAVLSRPGHRGSCGRTARSPAG
jgi:hypothetical protein